MSTALPRQVIDAFLRLHGSNQGGAFFLGGTYSMAEVMCTGFLQRALPTLPAYRNIDLRAMVREAKLDRWVGPRFMFVCFRVSSGVRHACLFL